MLSFISVKSSWMHRRAVLVMGVLLGMPGQSARGGEPGTRCDGALVAKLLGLAPRDWQVACWRLDDGRKVLAAVPLPRLVPANDTMNAPRSDFPKARGPESAAGLVVRLGLARDEAVLWRGELRPDARASADLREVLEKSEEWLVGVEDLLLGTQRGVRIGVVGHWGQEVMSVREIALLFRLPTDGGAMRLAWSGLGNTRESRLDYCLIEGMATFQQIDDKTLERQMRITSSINRDTKLPKAKARDLEKKCVVKPEDPRRFPVSP